MWRREKSITLGGNSRLRRQIERSLADITDETVRMVGVCLVENLWHARRAGRLWENGLVALGTDGRHFDQVVIATVRSSLVLVKLTQFGGTGCTAEALDVILDCIRLGDEHSVGYRFAALGALLHRALVTGVALYASRRTLERLKRKYEI